MGRYSMPLLFVFLTAIFVFIAVAAARHGRWIIAIPAAGIGLWMLSFAWSALKRSRRR